MAVSCVAPDQGKSYPIVLGRSFFQHRDGSRPTGFVGATYRFKPSSVDQSQPGKIEFENTSVRLQFQRRNTNNSGDGPQQQMIRFQGESKKASDREFFLWFDASSQRLVLERAGIQIKQLKHDRQPQKASASNSYNDKSQDRMKQMLERHKKKARLKSKALKGKKKNTTILSTKKAMTPNPPPNTSNGNKNGLNPRSQSLSVSPGYDTNNNDRGRNLKSERNSNNNSNSNTHSNTNSAYHPPSRPPPSAPPNMPSSQFRREQIQIRNRGAGPPPHIQQGVRNLNVSSNTNTNRPRNTTQIQVNRLQSQSQSVRNHQAMNNNGNQPNYHQNARNGNNNNNHYGNGSLNGNSNGMGNNNYSSTTPSLQNNNAGNGGPQSLFGAFDYDDDSEDDDLFD